jgi:hypothetical protein
MALRKLASEVVSGLGVRCLVSGPCGSSSSVVGPAFASYMSRGFATGTCFMLFENRSVDDSIHSDMIVVEYDATRIAIKQFDM